MGQTLSHGVYLPNEGERNCYAGLASNWQILNTAVGAIAEKAPLVHTHTVSQVTDFPAYGTTAGTICEGNDSRLSDARTPVAHTHTKSDVTDLLNSDFIPSANNSYDLGSSSYQWKKIYSADVVHTTGDENIVGIKSFINIIKMKSNVIDNTVTPTTNQFKNLYITDKNDVLLGTLYYAQRTNNNRELNLQVYNPNASEPLNFNLVHTGNTRNAVFQGDNFVPNLTNTNLGTSTNKWKTLNGINPGALSLPGNSSGINTDNWDKTGATTNSYTPAVDGWLVLRCKDVAGDYLFATWSGGAMGASVTGQGLITLPAAGLCLYIPVKAGTTVDCVVKATNKFGAYIYPCLGNVPSGV